MKIRVPEKNKKPGLHYAVTDDGIELPVIDVTHTAFSSRPSDSELDVLRNEALRSFRKWQEMPGWVRWLVSKVVLGRGVLARGIVASRGTYLAGLSTYLLKLGPDGLGSYAKRVDRIVAATLPAISARIRLQNMARILADSLAPILRADAGRPLHFYNIGGGPAADSFNTLLLLKRDLSQTLSERPIRICSLDLDRDGPSFGQRAVAALMAEDAPLHGLELTFEHVPYDWSRPEDLRGFLAAEGKQNIAACSSEGALLEYGSDEQVVANLRALHDETAEDSVFVGSVTRTDPASRELHRGVEAALKLRDMPEVDRLVNEGGWAISATADGPVNRSLKLVRA